MAKRDSGCGSCEIPVAYKDIRDSDERMAEESASPRASREVSVWASGKWGSTIDFSGFWGHENASFNKRPTALCPILSSLCDSPALSLLLDLKLLERKSKVLLPPSRVTAKRASWTTVLV